MPIRIGQHRTDKLVEVHLAKLVVIFNRLTRYSVEDDLYISYALDTPGCMAQGATIAEAEAELEKVREDYLRDWWKEVGIAL